MAPIEWRQPQQQQDDEYDDEYDDANLEAQRNNRNEPDIDGISAIHELKCPNDACDCNDNAKDSPFNWSTFDDPSYKDTVDIRDEWKFWSDCNACQDLSDDIKLREYFKIETLASKPRPEESSEGEEVEEVIDNRGADSQLVFGS